MCVCVRLLWAWGRACPFRVLSLRLSVSRLAVGWDELLCAHCVLCACVSKFGSLCSMPAKAIPLSLDAALVMDLRDFILSLDDGGDGDATDAVVAILHAQQVRSTRRLACTPVRCLYMSPAPFVCWACRLKIWNSV